MSFRQHSARLLYFIRWTSNHLHASKDVSAGQPDPELQEYIVSAMQQRCKRLRQFNDGDCFQVRERRMFAKTLK